MHTYTYHAVSAAALLLVVKLFRRMRTGGEGGEPLRHECIHVCMDAWMRECVCLCVCVCARVCLYVWIYVIIHTYDAYIYISIVNLYCRMQDWGLCAGDHSDANTHAHTYVQTQSHAHTCAHAYPCTHIHRHSQPHACTHTHRHTHSLANIHTNTHTA